MELLRKEVLELLSKSVSYGNLGAFIGAGFSKAVLNSEKNIALSWGDLLKQASKNMNIEYDGIKQIGVGFPDVASAICKEHSVSNAVSYEQSLSELKQKIAALTSWYPDKEQREKYSNYLSFLSPSWIITTNYDLVIEGLLTGKSIPLGPNDSLSSPKGVIPVFHLHGRRTNPEEIIIAQEDYIALFRPTEYRQIKLALTIKESTTLLLGYALGDVNVLTALDWSKNVYKGESVNYPNAVVQVLRKDKPCDLPYEDRSGIIVLEVESLDKFFDEFMLFRKNAIEIEQKELKDLETLADVMDEAKAVNVTQFLDDEKFRKETLHFLSRFPIDLISGFISFLNKCLDETWVRSLGYGAFEGYNQNLKIILDILTAFPMEKFPPALFETAAYGLQRVGYFVGYGNGQSHSAKRTWDARKNELNIKTVNELKHFSIQYNYNYLNKLVNSI
jgi:hypothetical protein